MKLKYTLLLSLLVLGACQQNNKSMDNTTASITDSNQEVITAANALQQQIKQINRFSQEPLYYIYVNHDQCFFQILINDIPIFNYFEDGQIMSPINLNDYIRHSGKQTITYKLYPQTKRSDGYSFDKLTSYTKMKIEVYERNNADTSNNFENQKLILTHHTATKPDGKTFLAEEKDYYEYTFDFEAKVPFDIKSWEEGKDLSKMDQEQLLKQTEAAYQYYSKIVSDKKQDDYFRLNYGANVSQIKSGYFDKAFITEAFEDDMALFTNPSFKLEPLTGYRLALYGNGRIASLEQVSNDLRLKKESAIWGKSKNEKGGTEATFLKLYLFIPKGKNTFEIVR